MHDVPSTMKETRHMWGSQKGMLGQTSPSGKRATNGHKALWRNWFDTVNDLRQSRGPFETVSHYVAGTCCVDQAGLKHWDPPASAWHYRCVPTLLAQSNGKTCFLFENVRALSCSNILNSFKVSVLTTGGGSRGNG